MSEAGMRCDPVRSAILDAVTALGLVTAEERPDLATEMRRLGGSPWPEFLDHDAVVDEHWGFVYEHAPEYQFALLDEHSNSLAAVGSCIPIRWDGNPNTLPDRGIDAVLEDAVACRREGVSPTAASALMIVVSPEWLGQGISGKAIRAMAEVVSRHGHTKLVAPVRPTHKHRYPLIPMEQYMHWRRNDGLPFDPWIRAHERVGGEILQSASAAMRVAGTVSEWEQWTGLAMPESGEYVIPDGLVPVSVDRERDIGVYLEPACWVRHRVKEPLA